MGPNEITKKNWQRFWMIFLDLRFAERQKEEIPKHVPQMMVQFIVIYHGIESVTNHQLNKSPAIHGWLMSLL